MDEGTDEDADKLINEVEQKVTGAGGGGVKLYLNNSVFRQRMLLNHQMISMTLINNYKI